MRASVLLLALSGGLLSPIFPESVQGQASEKGCLEPVPRPIQQRIYPPLRQGPSRGRVDPPTFHVSPQGKLCQAFHFEEEERPGPQVARARESNPGKAFVYSAMVPGTGQWLLGQDRWPAYLAVELWAWMQFLDWRREGRHLQTEYKDLAWLVARRVSTATRRDAGWEYYEALSHFQASGAYDRDPMKSGIQPEEDPTTFNGSIWVLAQEIFLPENPENPPQEGSAPYEKAFEYYASRAYNSGLAWDWGTNALHKEEYAGLIRKSDEALRSSTGMIGVILANHLLSAVDALVSGRLGIAGRVDPSIQVRLIPGPFGVRDVALQVRLPNPLAHDF